MNNYPPAGFFLRFLAYFNEKLIFLLLTSLYLWNISKNNTLSSVYQGAVVLLVIIVFYFLLGIVYNVLFTHYFGGNLGKLVTGLRIKDQSGNKLAFNKILFRQLLSYQFSWLVFGLGFLSVLKDPNKQAWHDKTVDSNVFKVQSLLPLALLVFLLTLVGTGYLLKSSFDNFLNSPVKQEVLGLIAAFQKQSKDDKNSANQQISKEIQDQQKKIISLVDSKKFDEALKAAQIMLQNSKTDTEKALSYETIGDIYLVKSNPQEAKKAYLESLKYSDQLYFTYSGLAEIAISEKNYQQAEEYMQKSINLAPDFANSYYRLGIIKFLQQDKTQAIYNLEKAIQLDPTNQLYKTDLSKIKESEQPSLPKPASTSQSTPNAQTNQSSNPGYTQADIKSWQDELSFINQDLSNIPKFLGNSSYDQGKLNQMSTLLEQRKAIANQIYTKMVNNQTLTAQDDQAMNTYDQLTAQYASLANQVFPRQ